VQDFRNLIYGSALVALMLYEPRGVLGDGSYLWRHISPLAARLRALLATLHITSPPAHSLGAAASLESSKIPQITASPASHAAGSILQTRDLTKRFGGLLAVNAVNIEVFPNDIFGVIGPNGAGKTTLFNLLSGTLACTSGEIRFRGEAIHGLSPYRIAQRGIGRTFQVVRPFAELSVMDNVLAGIGARFCTSLFGSLRPYRRKVFRDQARAILDQTGLGDYENELARNLPLGLLRRLEIARALGLRPNLILLDESFSGLSHREALSLLDLIRELREGGTTIILIEHNMQITMNLCNRIAVLDRGAKIAEGTPAEVQNDAAVVNAYLGSDDDA
jgi:ABC-type branched-subunit amino acid transport system ATPase component